MGDQAGQRKHQDSSNSDLVSENSFQSVCTIEDEARATQKRKYSGRDSDVESRNTLKSDSTIDDGDPELDSRNSLQFGSNLPSQGSLEGESSVMQSQGSVHSNGSYLLQSEDSNDRIAVGDGRREDVNNLGMMDAGDKNNVNEPHPQINIDRDGAATPPEGILHHRWPRMEEDLEDLEELDDEELEIVGDDGGNDNPIYEGAKISVAESLTAILTYAITHNLSNIAIYLLSLISLHCITTNENLRSFYMFKKFFSHLKTSIVSHYYCSVCSAVLRSKSDVCVQCPQSKADFFLSMSIIEQLRTLMKRKGFKSMFQYSNEREKKFPDNYEDIYDGNLYKEKVREGFLNGHNLSFTWNSDGVSIFKSSKYSIWPFYLVINELKYSERFKEENMILAGLWFGEKKTVPHIFLAAFKDELVTLYETGVPCQVPEDPLSPLQVKAVMLCGSCDLPATAMFLNMIQYNGYYPCHKCLIKGERDNDEGNFPKIVYPGGELLQPRNEDNTRECADLALVRGEPVNGIKGHVTSLALYPNVLEQLLSM